MKCPCCKGYGGETEPILDDGSGPWYDCGFCKGTGKINLIQRIHWWFIVKNWLP